MSVVEAQTPLPAGLTGHDLTIAEARFNPHNGFYEPPLNNPPLNANIAVTAAAQNLIAGLVAANPVWIYHMVFANNTAGVITYTLTEPGGGLYVVTVPANNTIVVVGTVEAPLFRSTAVGAIQITGSAAASGFITVAYIVK